MSPHLFQLRCNTLKLRYRRSVIKAQKRSLAHHFELNKILGVERPVPQRLAHLQTARP
jgi:hypothetical protein